MQMKRHPVLSSLAFASAFGKAFGSLPSSSSTAQGCALLMGDTIYCYGGARFTADTDDEKVATSSAIYALGLDGNEQLNDWREVSSHGMSMGPNAAFAVSPLPDGNGMVIFGGWGANGGKADARSQNIIFYANSGNWRSLYSYPQPQLTYEMPAVLDSNRTIWIWGGKLIGDDAVAEPENMGVVDMSQKHTTRQIAFPSGLHGRRGHSAALGPDGRTIYYFGGLDGKSERRELDDDHDGFKNAPMNEILVFDTQTQRWDKRTTTGSVVPSPRYFHTTTTIQSTNDILLYGGRQFDTQRPVDDFCYRYNTDRNEWTQVQMPATSGAGPRWGHSAVLHKSRLFILFGVGPDGTSTDDFYVFNIDTNQWEGSIGGGSTNDGSHRNGGTIGGGGGGGGDTTLSGGAIAGIVIAIIIALIIVPAGFLLYRRKKNAGMNQQTWFGSTRPQGKDELLLVPPPKDVPPQHAMMNKEMRQLPDPMLAYKNAAAVEPGAVSAHIPVYKPDEPGRHDKIAVIKGVPLQKPNE